MREFALVGLAVALTLLACSPTVAPSPPSEPVSGWPTFLMILRKSTPSYTDTLRIIYLARDRWCVERISGDEPITLPDGLVIPRPIVNTPPCTEDQVRDRAFSELPINYWLWPGKVPEIAWWPGATTIDVGGGLATVSAEVRHPPSMVPGDIERREVTYRTADGIPLRYSVAFDGKLTSWGEVLALRSPFALKPSP